MKQLILALMVFMIAPTLVSCGKKDNKRTPVGDRQQRNGGNSPEADSSGGGDPQTSSGSGVSNKGYVYGQIYRDTGKAHYSFADNIKGFVSSTIDPWGDSSGDSYPQLGYVSDQPGQQTGVWIRGNVSTQGGELDKANTSIRIIIWDEFAGRTDESGNVIPEYGLSFNGATSNSYINYNSNRAVLRFQDSYGWVEFDGQFDDEWFWGEVRYFNNVLDESVTAYSSPWDGHLGEFYIPVSGFFN